VLRNEPTDMEGEDKTQEEDKIIFKKNSLK
jgi:hypothetical protein